MNLLNVEPYDLMRVIESFLRAENSLPTLLKLHMSHVEERLLEECMWTADSPVFSMLQVLAVRTVQHTHLCHRIPRMLTSGSLCGKCTAWLLSGLMS